MATWSFNPTGSGAKLAQIGETDSYEFLQEGIEGEEQHKLAILRKLGEDFSILQIEAPEASGREATLTLMRKGDGVNAGPEFLDLFSMNYPDGKANGIRVQSRGAGELNPFVFEFNDGRGVKRTMSIFPDGSIKIGNATIAIGATGNMTLTNGTNSIGLEYGTEDEWKSIVLNSPTGGVYIYSNDFAINDNQVATSAHIAALEARIKALEDA